MATVAEFTVDAADFPLGALFDDLPDAQLELERVVPTSDAFIPYLWIQGVELTDIESLLISHPEVGDLSLVDDVDTRYLIRATWEEDYEGILKAITQTDVTLLSGRGTADSWTFEVRGDDQEAISAFQQYCREHNIPITLTTLHALAQMENSSEHNLTETQREALVLAYEHGYFDTPREVSLDEIAEELDITGQSLGSRIRRGTKRLIGSTLTGS